VGRNGLFEFGRFDGQEKAIDFGTPKSGSIDQQNHIGR